MKRKTEGQRREQRGKVVARKFATPSEDEIARAQQRIGTTPQDRLAWAVRVVQRPQNEMTPGDWDNLRSELAAFIWPGEMVAQLLDLESEDLTMVVRMLSVEIEKRRDARQRNPITEERVDTRPTEKEAKEALTRMGEIIEAAVKRQPITLAPVRGIQGLCWVPEFSGWVKNMSHDVEPSYADSVASALGDLLEKVGALLKECPAPAIRAKEGETCGEWFVANRPRQEYCSAKCQSRASTRATRAGTETPAMQRRREQQKGG